MAEQVAKLLKDYLEEMNDSRLSEFKWYLSQHKQNGCRPLQRSQLESGTRTDTVDQLVQTFGEDSALVVAVDILYRMGLNHLATKLAQAKIDREAEERPAEEERLPAQKLKAPKDLFCSICLCIFQTPVMLQCGHSFCRSCVLQTWAGKLSRKCPLCEQVSAEGPPQVNFSLKSLSESFLETHAEPAAARRDDSPREVRTKQEEFQKVMSICSSAVERLERQSRATEMKIREEFEKLGRCLKTEEANRLAALKQEEVQRIRLIQMIMEASRDMFSLSDTVKNMEELVTGGSFIPNFKSSLESTQKVLLAPELIQVQIDEDKYVDNLQLRVLKKMLKIIKNIPEASPRLLPPDAQPEVTVKVTCKYPGQASRHPQVLVHRRGPGPADGEAEQERALLFMAPSKQPINRPVWKPR